MAALFDDILVKGVRSGQIPARTKQARNWYRDTARSMKRVNENKIMKGDADRLTARPLLGNMFLFQYDAKHKATLPYWDRLPLIFPFKKVKGGFYGINMHYLPLPMRAKLMDALYDVTNNNKFDESTKLRISYNILNRVSELAAPCMKHYLSNHTKSRFLYIYPSEWDICLFMPLERFQKQSKSQVWSDTKKILKGSHQIRVGQRNWA